VISLTFIKAGIITRNQSNMLKVGDIKKRIDNKIYFIWRRNVYFDAKINKMDTCLVENFKFTF
jgi:hypothetical protein